MDWKLSYFIRFFKWLYYPDIDATKRPKPGSRHIPLINSLPYIKDWLDEHPQQGNPNAPLIWGYNKSLGRRIKPTSITKVYEHYKKGLFSKLASMEEEQWHEGNTQYYTVSKEDKQKIRKLLKKPWNPYIQSALNTKDTKPEVQNIVSYIWLEINELFKL